jgi:hypothetical protein
MRKLKDVKHNFFGFKEEDGLAYVIVQSVNVILGIQLIEIILLVWLFFK